MEIRKHNRASDLNPDLKRVCMVKILLHSTISFAVCAMIPAFSLADSGLKSQLERDKALFAKLGQHAAPQIFAVSEIFPWASRQRPTAIVYGNEEIGYFSSQNFQIEKGKLTFKFIPPTYRRPLIFSALLPDQKLPRKLADKKYKNPIGDFTDLTSAEGSLSFPFVMMNGTTQSMPLALNRLGEIVWLFPNLKDPSRLNTNSIEILENGEFLFMALKSSTRLTWINSFGQIRYDIDFQKSKIPYPSTHTVQYLKKTNEILFISPDCRKLSAWNEFIPLFQGPAGWLRLLKLPRRTYAGSKILRMSLDTLKVKEVWNSFQDFSPSQNPSLASGYLTMADRYMDATDENQYLSLLKQKDFSTWAQWPDEQCNVDWTHENSVQYIEGKGYLISVRNLNEVIFLNEDGRLQWRIGEGPGADFRFPFDGSSFSLQHSAVMRDDGSILLYDNRAPYRGFSGTRFGNRVLVLNPQRPGPFQVQWSFNLFSAHSEARGSVAPLPHNRIFGYTAGNPGVPSEIFELDIGRKAKVGSLWYKMYQGNKGFEAKPFWSFGGDTYLGWASSSVEQPTRSESGEDFLQFSY